jgi:cytochrome c
MTPLWGAFLLFAACSQPATDPDTPSEPSSVASSAPDDQTQDAPAPEARQTSPAPSRDRTPAGTAATATVSSTGETNEAEPVEAATPIIDTPDVTETTEQDRVAVGRGVFATSCAPCHTASENGATRAGPNLYGIAGKPAASLASFAYSPALRNSGIIWTTEQLQAFIERPTRMVPGTRMTYAGVRDPEQAAAVVAYLESLQ